MRAHLLAVLCAASLVQACDTGPGRTFRLPTAPDALLGAPAPPPSPPAPPPSPAAPLPRPPVPEEFTTLVVGEPFLGKVGQNPPRCRDGHGFCQFFKLIPTRDGILTATLSFDVRQPASSSMDLSIITPDAEVWGDFFLNGVEVRTPAVLGADYFITVWYGNPGAEFTLVATIRPE